MIARRTMLAASAWPNRDVRPISAAGRRAGQAFVLAEIERWAQVVNETGVTVN